MRCAGWLALAEEIPARLRAGNDLPFGVMERKGVGQAFDRILQLRVGALDMRFGAHVVRKVGAGTDKAIGRAHR